MTWRMKYARLQLRKPGNGGLTKRTALRSYDSLVWHWSFLLRLTCLTAFLNRCAVRKSYFHFATKELARRYIVEEPREESRTQRHQSSHFGLSLASLTTCCWRWSESRGEFCWQGMRAGTRFTVSPFDWSCGAGFRLCFVFWGVFLLCCLFCLFYPTWPFHYWLLGLPTISS